MEVPNGELNDFNWRNVTITPSNIVDDFTANMVGVEGNLILFIIRLEGVKNWQEITVTLRKDGHTFNPSSRSVLLEAP